MSVDLVFQFLGEQWLLVVALVATLTMLVLHEGRKAGPALSINEAVQLVNGEDGVFLDIRDAGDFARFVLIGGGLGHGAFFGGAF